MKVSINQDDSGKLLVEVTGEKDKKKAVSMAIESLTVLKNSMNQDSTRYHNPFVIGGDIRWRTISSGEDVGKNPIETVAEMARTIAEYEHFMCGLYLWLRRGSHVEFKIGKRVEFGIHVCRLVKELMEKAKK